MAQNSSDSRWQIDGKFFRYGNARIHPRMVTYGPFPGGWPNCFRKDFKHIAETGFDAIRTFELPGHRMLESAQEAGLKVFAGLAWQQHSDFISHGGRLTAAKIELADWLTRHGDHPAVAGVYVGNEVPLDLVRWMGPDRVRVALEELIALGKQIIPELLYAYANFPSTEYLEPGNADFSAFNLYLEKEEKLESYIRRLHHVAGDRPLVISEFGLDTQRNPVERQAQLLCSAANLTRAQAVAGFTVFAWSDRWLSGGIEVEDWDFGITDRNGNDKPAVAALRGLDRVPTTQSNPKTHALTVIVCTRNGRNRIGGCLQALEQCDFQHGIETMVIDDGSTDGTADYVAAQFPDVELVRVQAFGLSAARNTGAQLAKSDILAYTDDDCEPDRDWLHRVYDFLQEHPDYAAVGGPNLPQIPKHHREAVVCAAPGAPSHVMLDDMTAEHLPGCNLVVRKSALIEAGGFDARFHTAGDDVDFCWRLQDAGWKLGFDPGAFVWHWRRPSIRTYLRQQIGYGKAERMLIAKHSQRFNQQGSALWKGCIYSGAPVRVTREAVIYHGTVEKGTYHPSLGTVQTQRNLYSDFDDWKGRFGLMLCRWLAPAVRGWYRNGSLRAFLPTLPSIPQSALHNKTEQWSISGTDRDQLIGTLLEAGWKACDSHDLWDLEKDGKRVIVATETGYKGAKRSLVRVDGIDSSVRSLLG